MSTKKKNKTKEEVKTNEKENIKEEIKEENEKEKRKKEIRDVNTSVIDFAKDLVEATIEVKKVMNGARPAVLNDYMPITKKTSTYQIAEYILNLYDVKRKK